MNSLCWKSFAAGALLVLILAGLIAATDASGPRAQIGRFTIDSYNGHHVFLVDTATGKVWEKLIVKNTHSISGDFNSRKVDDIGRIIRRKEGEHVTTETAE